MKFPGRHRGNLLEAKTIIALTGLKFVFVIKWNQWLAGYCTLSSSREQAGSSRCKITGQGLSGLKQSWQFVRIFQAYEHSNLNIHFWLQSVKLFYLDFLCFANTLFRPNFACENCCKFSSFQKESVLSCHASLIWTVNWNVKRHLNWI